MKIKLLINTGDTTKMLKYFKYVILVIGRWAFLIQNELRYTK